MTKHSNRHGRVFTSDFWLVLLAAGVTALAAWPLHPPPIALINLTQSEPIGLYLREEQAPMKVGDLVAFTAPAAAQNYEDRRGTRRLKTFLKSIAAASGDLVCSNDKALWINGKRTATIASKDRSGFPLPQWGGCRRLSPSEIFAISTNVPNSFDSRYFGPIDNRAVQGVFKLVALAPTALP